MENQSNKYYKDFDAWHLNKRKIDEKEARPPFFKNKQIWWVRCGVNVGTEIDGKGKLFLRPFLIIKKNGKNNAVCIPMTSDKQNRKRNYVYKTFIQSKKVCFVLSQIKNIDTKRLFKYHTEISTNKFKKIKKAFIKYIK